MFFEDTKRKQRASYGTRITAYFVLMCIALVIPISAITKQEDYINIWFFAGKAEDSSILLTPVEVMTRDSHPEISLIKDSIAASDAEIKVATIDCLSQIYRLQSIEDVFSFHKNWIKGVHLIDDVTLAKLTAYRLKLSIKALPDRQASIHATILRTKKGIIKSGAPDEGLTRAYLATREKNLMDTLVDHDVVLKADEPVIVRASSGEEIYFVMLLLTSGNRINSPHIVPLPEKTKSIEIHQVPKPLVHPQPFYPAELRRRKVGGDIQLLIRIDEKGNVLGVDNERPLHPYLDYAAVQAFLKWKFEPALLKGRAVRASFRYTYSFDPLSSSEQNVTTGEGLLSPSSAPSDELRNILTGCGKYCRTLSGAVFDFICEETIKESHYNLIDNISWATLILSKRYDKENDATTMVARSIQIMDPKRTARNEFLCDYLITRKDSGFVEKRILLKENGHRLSDRNRVLEERRFSGLSSLLSPLRLLAEDRQSLFEFTRLEDQSIHGKKAFVIAAVPKSGNEDGIWSAKIWLSKDNNGILRCDIEGIPIDGYEDVLGDCATLNIKPSFLTSHEYRVERNGIFFPSQSKIRVSYPAIDVRGPIEKIRIDLLYDQYKFFIVNTESQVHE